MAVIWLFLIVFLVYPLLRIFYDAVTDEAGPLTLANFRAFFSGPLLPALAVATRSCSGWPP